MADLQQGRPVVNVAQAYLDRPAIHVGLANGAPEALYHWVDIGAEEEGVPCRQMEITAAADVVALAYAAAQSSRLGIGVGITPNQVAVHEVHMPADRPILLYESSSIDRAVCRLAGSNAARLVVGVALQFED